MVDESMKTLAVKEITGTVKITADSNNDYYKKNKAGSSSGSNLFTRDLASAVTGGPVVYIVQTNSGDDQPSLQIHHDGDNSAILITTVTAKAAPIELVPQADPPATAREGMIYMDTNHHLYVHNGTTWVQCDN